MRLPKSVQQVAEIIGYQKAMRLVFHWLQPIGKRGRNKSLYVPKPQNLKTDHKLVHYVGWADAMAICEALGGVHLHFPECKYMIRAMKDREILNYYDLGYLPSEIAEILGFSVDWVEKITEADEMVRAGESVEVVAYSMKISPRLISFIWRIEIDGETGPVTSRTAPRIRPESVPQMRLEL